MLFSNNSALELVSKPPTNQNSDNKKTNILKKSIHVQHLVTKNINTFDDKFHGINNIIVKLGLFMTNTIPPRVPNQTDVMSMCTLVWLGRVACVKCPSQLLGVDGSLPIIYTNTIILQRV
jgi:hypothetical protein